MTERRLVEVVQNICQSFIARPPRSESGPIGLTQCGYERIAMFLADSAVLVSMAAVESRLLCHDRFLGSMGKSAITIHLGIDFGDCRCGRGLCDGRRVPGGFGLGRRLRLCLGVEILGGFGDFAAPDPRLVHRRQRCFQRGFRGRTCASRYVRAK